MVRVSLPGELRPWSELTAKMVMGVVPGLVKNGAPRDKRKNGRGRGWAVPLKGTGFP